MPAQCTRGKRQLTAQSPQNDLRSNGASFGSGLFILAQTAREKATPLFLVR